jgi:hypothetical protein
VRKKINLSLIECLEIETSKSAEGVSIDFPVRGHRYLLIGGCEELMGNYVRKSSLLQRRDIEIYSNKLVLLNHGVMNGCCLM